MIKDLLKDQTKLNTTLLIIFYSVGLVGMLLAPKYFAVLTPFNLMLSLVLMLWGHALVNCFFIVNMLFIWIWAWL